MKAVSCDEALLDITHIVQPLTTTTELSALTDGRLSGHKQPPASRGDDFEDEDFDEDHHVVRESGMGKVGSVRRSDDADTSTATAATSAAANDAAAAADDDVGTHLHGVDTSPAGRPSADELARELRANVLRATGLRASVGIAPNVLLARYVVFTSANLHMERERERERERE